MKFKRRVRNRRVIRVVVATLMTFLMTLSSGYAQSKHQHHQHSDKTKIVHNIKPVQQQKQTKLKTRDTYYAGGNAYMQQGKRMSVKATAYADDPITYTGAIPKVGYTIAVDPSIIPLGTRVYIPKFDRVFIAEDTGSAIKGHRIDIFMATEDDCVQWGIQDIDIYILGK